MRFTRSEEHREMAGALRDLLAAADTTSIARGWAADDLAWRTVWKELADMGVTGIAAPEACGGVDLGPVALVACLEELGYSGLPGPVVESIAALPPLLRGGDDAVLTQVVSGRFVVTVGFDENAGQVLDADRADVVFACGSDRIGIVDHDRGEPKTSIDPTRRLSTVAISDSTPVRDNAAGAVRAAFDQGVLGTAAQLLGVGRRLLDLSTAYVRERHQFGRPVGEFQAVKHHLANTLLKLEFARPLLHGACVSVGADATTAARDISAAKIAAGEAAYLAARTALQVHGAIGYTVEHDLHLWVTKAIALRTAWGTPSWHRKRVADALRFDGDTPIGAG